MKDFEETALNKKKLSIKGTEKGRAKVADIFEIKDKKGNSEAKKVPGVRVETGKLSKSHKFYVYRNGSVATDGFFPKSIKVFKK